MAGESTVSRSPCRAAALVSGIVLLLVVIVVQHHAVTMRRFLMPEYQRLHVDLPLCTLALVTHYPAALGLLAVVASGVWLVTAFFLRRDTVTVIINCCLLLLAVMFVALHAWASVLPYATAGRT